MAYQALYRKWRPKTFDDVKGQEAIVRTLKNQIKTGRIGHAYLFCGTRGTGKTSVAKIFARAVNCEDPQDGSPCGECDSCKAIASGSSLNVVEIDAASNNGVDNIREIREQVQYQPTQGRYRVYIIDEVHMLSSAAFNALLKTLEEPPSYVIFILATTEIQKIPLTILSRCQRYDFHRIPTDTIFKQLKDLVQKEGLAASDQALRYVARQGDGSMRDALSLLDECLSFYIGKDLEYEDVLKVLGAADTQVYSGMLQDLLRLETDAALGRLNDILLSGQELPQFVSGFIWYLRNVLLVLTSADMTITADLVDMNEDNFAQLKENAKLCLAQAGGKKPLAVNTLIRFIELFSDLAGRFSSTSQKRILTEVAIIQCTRPSMDGLPRMTGNAEGATTGSMTESASAGAADSGGAGGSTAGLVGGETALALEQRINALERQLEGQEEKIRELESRPVGTGMSGTGQAPDAATGAGGQAIDPESPAAFGLPEGDASAAYLRDNWKDVLDYLSSDFIVRPYAKNQQLSCRVGKNGEFYVIYPGDSKLMEGMSKRIEKALKRVAERVQIKVVPDGNTADDESNVPKPAMEIETRDTSGEQFS
jgi:DNA polymerase-3 subunit gamma/tau